LLGGLGEQRCKTNFNELPKICFVLRSITKYSDIAMQRRTVPARHGPSNAAARTNDDDEDDDNYRGGKRKSGGRNSVIFVSLLSLLLLIAVVGSVYFPSQLQRAEQEAGVLAKKAMEVENDLEGKVQRIEHDVAERILGQQQQQRYPQHHEPGSSSGNINIPVIMEEHLQASYAATARMEAQSGRWVDGEKKLKQKLQVLYDRQHQQGLDLGVPVLTRWLGDDIPAYVTPEMNIDVMEWKRQISEKYAEMRKEEEEWQAKMNKVIEQRERDIGITTA
jgi:hypothetical protein